MTPRTDDRRAATARNGARNGAREPACSSGSSVSWRAPPGAGATAGATFDDCHVHLTNYIQKGDRHPRLPGGHGRQGGPRGAVRHPAAAAVVVSRHRGLRADLLPPDRRAALLLLVHRRGRSRRPYRSLTPERAGALRSDDHRLQPDGHVRGRSHPAGAHDLSRRVLRHRRVHDPQGVRLLQGRRRRGEPHATRRSIGSSTSPAEVGLVVLIHSDIDMPFPKPGAAAGLPRAAARLFRRHPKTTIIWAHMRRRPRRPALSSTRRDARRAARRSGARATSTSTSPGTRSQSTWSRTPETIAATAAASSTATPTAFCSAPTRWRRRTRRHYLRVYRQYEPLLAAARREDARAAAARGTTSGSSTRRGGACARGRRRRPSGRPATPRA